LSTSPLSSLPVKRYSTFLLHEEGENNQVEGVEKRIEKDTKKI
jgi:hypothetical protein